MYPFIAVISSKFLLKNWNINIKFPLILRISNYVQVWISLKRLFINKNKIKHYLFFSGAKPRSDQIRLLYSWWSKQIKDSTLKETIKKRQLPIDSITMENNSKLFSTSSNIAQQLKGVFDYVVGNWELDCSCLRESKVFRFHWRRNG